MTTKHLVNPVTLTIELDDLTWLRAFLKEERRATEIDQEEVERLHTDVAIRTAKAVLSKEHDRMTTIIDDLDAAIGAADMREAVARKIAATLPAQPPARRPPPPNQPKDKNTMRRIANNTALLVIYQLIASASVLYGSLSILASIYERNLAFGLLSVIPTIAGVALFAVATINELEEQQGGEAE